MTKFQIALLAIAATGLAVLAGRAVMKSNKPTIEPNERLQMHENYRDLVELAQLRDPREAKAAERAENKVSIEAHRAFLRDAAENGWAEFAAPARHEINQIEHCIRQIGLARNIDGYGPLVADLATAKTVTLINGRTLVMANTTQARDFMGDHISTRVWLNDTCTIVAGALQYHTLYVTPTPAVPDAEARLAFRKPLPYQTSKFFANIARNELVMWHEPYVETASLETSGDEVGCLHKTVARGQSAALTTSITDVCPNSAGTFKATNMVYHFIRLSFDKEANRNFDNLVSSDSVFVDKDDEQYVFTTTFGVGLYPQETLHPDDYKWYPLITQRRDWKTEDAN